MAPDKEIETRLFLVDSVGKVQLQVNMRLKEKMTADDIADIKTLNQNLEALAHLLEVIDAG